MKRSDIPPFEFFMNPVIKALKELGGSGTVEEINKKVTEETKLSDEQLKFLHYADKGSQTEVEYRLAWARTYLKKYGVLENPKRGIWTLTVKGKKLDNVDPVAVNRYVREQIKKEKKIIPVSDDSNAAEGEERWIDLLDDDKKKQIRAVVELLVSEMNDKQELEKEKQELKKANEKLRAELKVRKEQEEALGISFVHTSPDFGDSDYSRKVTSIKDTIRDMLKRAEHTIRISTRQMDMFTDQLIALKRRSPEIEITVLSRGSETVGDRKRIAGRNFGMLKKAGIKMAVEKEMLHSRLVVIDEKEVLASSADLDYTHMDLEFNAGIWTNNPDVVAEAIRYFDNLVKFANGH